MAAPTSEITEKMDREGRWWEDPLGFITNLLGEVKQTLKGLWAQVTDWLVGEITDRKGREVGLVAVKTGLKLCASFGDLRIDMRCQGDKQNAWSAAKRSRQQKLGVDIFEVIEPMATRTGRDKGLGTSPKEPGRGGGTGILNLSRFLSYPQAVPSVQI